MIIVNIANNNNNSCDDDDDAMHKLLWDFNIQTDHLIPARTPDLIIINKKKREFAKLSTLLSRLTIE